MNFILCCFILCHSTIAQVNPPGQYKIAALKISGDSIRVDGILNEDEWEKTESIVRFTQRTPHFGQPATEETVVKILYDDDHLYIGAVCYHKDMRHVVATKLAHRDVNYEDLFGFVLDTFHDHIKAYGFEVNALGAKEEFFVDGPEGGQTDPDWNEVWEVRAKINDNNWTAEFKIPLRILRFPDENIQTWGFNAVRLLRKKNETVYWAPIPPQFTVTNLSLAGDLTGLKGLKMKRNLQLRPYSLLGASREKEVGGTVRKADFGFDLKYVPRPNLAVDLTVRPDFAQIESDDEQINLTRFKLFYPEKRDFFLENAGLFEFGLRQKIQPFFSRQIGIHNSEPVPILLGARVTGKLGRTNVGIMNALTGEKGDLPPTNYSVLRLRQDVLENSNIGLIFTNVQSKEGHNLCWGVDSELWVSKNSRLKGFYSGVDAKEIDNQRSALHLSYWWNVDLWEFFLGYNGVEKNYNPAAGFVTINDIKDYSGAFRKSFRPARYGIRKVDFTAIFNHLYTQANSNFKRTNTAEFSAEFDSGDMLTIDLNNNFERFYDDFQIYEDVIVPVGSYSYNDASLQLEFNERRRVSGIFLLGFGDFYDGKRRSFAGEGLLKLNKHLLMGCGLESKDIHLPGGNFDTLIARLRLNLVFSSYLSLKMYAQYNSAEDRIILDARLCWLHGKDNELYLVYNNLTGTEFSRFRTVSDTAALKLNYRLYL